MYFHLRMRRLFQVLLLLFAGITAAQAQTNFSKNPKAQAAFELGEKAVEKRQLSDAVSHYKKAISHDASFALAYSHLGLAYRYKGSLDSAEYFYREALKVDVNNLDALQNLAGLYTSKKEYEKALSYYDRMIRVSKDDPEGHFGRARVLMIQGRYEDADKSASKALELYRMKNDSYAADAELLLGFIKYYLKDYEEARRYLKSAKEAGRRVPNKMLNELGII